MSDNSSQFSQEQIERSNIDKSRRKRIRCDSDPREGPKSDQKVYKERNDIDTDTEMEGFVCSANNSPLSSPTQSICPESSSSNVKGKSSLPTWKRDEHFYLEDGSCILLVGDTLFNVHRSILTKDSSSFGTMFSLPQGNCDAEGRSDNKPIVLMGDSPEEFRHFLWSLYALPPELKSLTSPTANLDHLIDITRVANKYSFKSMETWALDVIQDYVNRKPSPILAFIPPPHAYIFPGAEQQLSTWPSNNDSGQKETANQLTRLVRLAHLCQHEKLMGTMIGLLRQLMSSSVQYAYLAMSLSDELDLRSLRGAAYLEVMQKAVVVKKARIDVFQPLSQVANSINSVSPPSLIQGLSSSGDRVLDSGGRLTITREQQLRLLAGFYRLTSLWDKLRGSPPHFDHSVACGATWHQQGCTQSWLEFWKEKTRSDSIMNLGLTDVVGRLKLLQKDYDRWGSATYMHVDCRSNAKKAIGEIIKRVEDTLSDFFDESGGCEED